MLSIAIVVFREIFEISLVVAILLIATKGLPRRTPWVCLGLAMGLVGACLIAVFTQAISNSFEGLGQEIMNASIMFVAALFIAWTVLWMNRFGWQMTQNFKSIGHEVQVKNKPLYTLSVIIFLAVLREGAEIVLFLYSAVVTGGKIYQLVTGSLVGLLLGVSVGIVLYRGLIKVSTKKIFTVTSALLVFLVAGMVASGFGFLAAAGKVPELSPMVWDTSHLLSQDSLVGKLMHVLVGYSERPSGIQLLTFVLTLGGLFMALRFKGKHQWVPARKTIMVIMALIISIFQYQNEACATKKVYSPLVEKGEIEIEARGQYDFDHKHPQKNDVQKQKYAIGYGLTDWWAAEIEGEIEKARNDEGEDLNFRFTALELENKFQFTPQGQYWLDMGAMVSYEGSFEDKHPDKVQWKLLFEKSMIHFSHTANFIFTKEVGAGNAQEEVQAGASWSSKYRLREDFQPGFEYHADFGTMWAHHGYKSQEHQVGPAFYGRLWKHIRYDIGYLFGISPVAPLGELKWNLEYELRF